MITMLESTVAVSDPRLLVTICCIHALYVANDCIVSDGLGDIHTYAYRHSRTSPSKSIISDTSHATRFTPMLYVTDLAGNAPAILKLSESQRWSALPRWSSFAYLIYFDSLSQG